MDFNLSEEQQMLQDTVARLVRDHYGFEQRQRHYRSESGFSGEFWRRMGELGLLGVPFAEVHGGFGGSGVDNLLVMTELGRGLCLEPYLPSQIFAGGLLQQLGSTEQHERLLPPLIGGELQLAAAFEEPQSRYRLHEVRTRAVPVEGGWELNGRKAVVIGGHSAGMLMVSARTGGEAGDEEGVSLFLVDAQAGGLRRRTYPTVDGPKGCELYLERTFVPECDLLGEPGQALAALRYQQGRAIAAQCAEAVGSMEEACRLTLDYLKTRRQFGTPIGKFQALQHRMVDMRTELELATSMTILAACVADEPDGEERSRRLAAAKFIVVRAGRFIAEQAIQLHGGIGMTWEYVLAHHAKRLVMLGHQLGDDDHHLQVYAGLLRCA